MAVDKTKELKQARAEIKQDKEQIGKTTNKLEEAKKGEDEAKAEERREKAREAREEIAARSITVLTTALAVVAGLFWQTAITDTIKTFIPVSGAWQYEIIVALLVTVTMGSIIYFLSRSTAKPEKSKRGA